MVEAPKYKELFVDEAREHLQSVGRNLLTLEREPGNTEALNEMFRAVHTLKSMAATLGYPDIEKLAHEMENVLDSMRKERKFNKRTVDFLLECLDTLETLVESVASGETVEWDLKALYKKLENIPSLKEEGGELPPRIAEEKSKGAERVSPTIRIGVERIQALQNLVEELSIAKMRLLLTTSKHAISELNEITATIDRLTSELRDKVIQMRMFPIGYLFDRYPRTVRDLSRKTEKEVDFIVLGREIELDRLVLDEIHDAVMHLLRNAVDHGIEKPAERKKAGKGDTGKVVLSAMREGNWVVVSVEDDGRGMDVEVIKKIAIERNIITEEAALGMSDTEVYELLSIPGLSTTKEVTDVSGRGVGFDVVKSKIESQGGSVRISSEKGRGTIVELRLPLTTAIIQSLLVGVGKENYVIPLDSIREIVTVDTEDVKSVEGKEIFRYREYVLPLLRLKNILNVPGTKDRFGPVVVMERNGNLFGMMVDSLIGQQETVVKPLEEQLKERKEFAGATILGDGSVALILDIGGLLEELGYRMQDTG